MECNIPWGEEKLAINIPASWTFKGEILPNQFNVSENEDVFLNNALQFPIGSVPLREMKLKDKKVLIVIDDYTRPTPVSLLFRGAYDELKRSGVNNNDITILVALGTHEPMTEKQIKKRLGVEDTTHFNIINHNCFDNNELSFFGKTSNDSPVWLNKHFTSSDLIISIGTIEPHLLAGFGGGLKNIIPGCSGAESIASTHCSGDATKRFSNVGKMGEEVYTRMDLEEGALMFKGDYFIINTVLTPDKKVAGIFCGHPIKAHREGCRLAAEIYGAKVDEKYDVLLLNSCPMDTDLRQGSKCLAFGLGAAKENALLIAFMYCEKGVGDVIVREPFVNSQVMQCFARELGTEKLITIREKYSGKMSSDEIFMNQYLLEILRKHTVLVYSPNLSKGIDESLGYFEQFSDLEDLFKRAKELAPENSKVVSIPFGGNSYVI